MKAQRDEGKSYEVQIKTKAQTYENDISKKK